jgi:hypothetical protein
MIAHPTCGFYSTFFFSLAKSTNCLDLKQHFCLGMIAKYHTSIVVSCVKASMKKILLLPFLHAVAFVWWGESLIFLRDNLDNMTPLYQGINCIPHAILVNHPFPFVPSG